MEENSFNNEFNGLKIHSKIYGDGTVLSVDKVNNDYYITVVFFSNGTTFEKTFQASIAIKNNNLSFDADVFNIRMQLMLSDLKPQTAPVSTVASSNKFEISKNDYTNILIDSLISGEPIATLLISLYEDQNYEKDLCTEAFAYLEQHMNGGKLSVAKTACIEVALTLIALKYYNNGNLYSFIEQKYREYRPGTEQHYTWGRIQKSMYAVLGKDREKTKYFDLSSYVAVPIVLSCVPAYRVKDLFKISYDIYKKKLLFDEDIADEQIKHKVKETLLSLRRKDLISNSDAIKGTQYLMSRYTQSCIYSGFGIDELVIIITRCIRLIILYLTKPEDSFTVESYYLDGFNDWTKLFKTDGREFEKYQQNRAISRPYLMLYNNEVHLYTGEYSMDDSYDPNDVHIYVYSGENKTQDIHITDPNTIVYNDKEDALGGYIIKRCEIVLNGSPIDKLNYSIVVSGVEIYNSKNRLYRTALFFDGKGNEIRPGYEYNGELLVVAHSCNEDEYGERITTYYTGSGFVIFSIDVNSHEIFYFDDEPYIFYKINEPKLISYDVPWINFESVEGKSYPIYTMATMLFQASCEEADIILEIDGVRYSEGEISDIYYSIRLLSSNYDGNYAYTVKIYDLDAGYHTIKIYNSITGKQIKGASFAFVYDWRIQKKYIEKDRTGILYEISSSFSDKQALAYEYGSPIKKIPAFVKNLGHGMLNIYPSSISYSIDGETWMDIDNKIYLCDIPDSIKYMQFCGPNNMKAYYFQKTAVIKKQEANLKLSSECKNIYVLYLDYLRTLPGDKATRLCLEFGSRIKFVDIWYNPYINKEESKFYYDEIKGMHCFDVRFEGNSKLQVVLKSTESGQIIKRTEITSGQTIELQDSEVPTETQNISVLLYGKRYGSLFDSYQSEHFMTFPKYSLGRITTQITNWHPEIRINKNRLHMVFEFDGTEDAMIKVLPTGKDFKTPLFTRVISSNQEVSFDLSCMPFDSYTVCLYPVLLSDNTGNYSDTPIFVSKPIRRDSKYILQQKRNIKAFRTENGTLVNLPYDSVYFAKIEEINGRYYLVSKLIDSITGRSVDDILIRLIEAKSMSFIAAIRKKHNGKVVFLVLKNGEKLRGALVDKLGG